MSWTYTELPSSWQHRYRQDVRESCRWRFSEWICSIENGSWRLLRNESAVYCSVAQQLHQIICLSIPRSSVIGTLRTSLDVVLHDGMYKTKRKICDVPNVLHCFPLSASRFFASKCSTEPAHHAGSLVALGTTTAHYEPIHHSMSSLKLSKHIWHHKHFLCELGNLSSTK